MARVKRGVTTHPKHKKTFKAAKGFYGRRKNTIRAAKAAVRARPAARVRSFFTGRLQMRNAPVELTA